MGFGKKLRKLRIEKGLTQADLAATLSLGESTISFYESNKRQPDYETLTKIADLFKVSTDYLLGRTDNELSVNNIIPERFIQKLGRVLRSERGEVTPEVLPLILIQVATLYAASKGIFIPSSLPHMEDINMSDEEKSQLIKEFDEMVNDEAVSEYTALALAKEINTLPSRDRQAMLAMLEVLKGLDVDAAARGS
ncbi:MAG: helix-turn-helix transcriptional regulator [Dysgonamonadaceae bacterium]|nr:helix-turn-helix transcriptional regulator [Dysgonamonadaceae bacterium]